MINKFDKSNFVNTITEASIIQKFDAQSQAKKKGIKS